MRKISQSFSSRLSLNIISLTALAFVFILLAMSYSIATIMNQEAKKTATARLEATINEIENIITGVESAVNNQELFIKRNLSDPEFMYTITQNLIRSNNDIIGSTVAFRPDFYKSKGEFYAPYSYFNEQTGEIESKEFGKENYDYVAMEWFQIPYYLKQPNWCEPYFDEGGGNQKMVTYSYPILDDKNEVIAILTADVSLENLTENINKTKPYPEAYTVLISNTLYYIVSNDEDKLLNETLFSFAFESENEEFIDLAQSMARREKGDRIITSSDGKRSLVVYDSLRNRWIASIVCPISEVLAPVTTMEIIALLGMIVGLALIFIFCKTIVNKTAKPLAHFADSARKIAHGDFNADLPNIKSKDEMLELHDSFSYMQKNLTQYIQKLKETRSQKERIEGELSVARSIQLGMVPKDFKSYLHAVLHPAREVGGDLYDFYEKDGYLNFCIGDVSGKGVPAALYMAIAKASYNFITANNVDLGIAMSKLNNVACKGNDTCVFITMFIGRMNLSTGHLQYCNGGHNPPVVILPDGKAEFLEVESNMALGLFEDFEYVAQETQFQPGTRLMLYTDGVTEAERADESQYGEERLLNYLGHLNTDACPADITSGLVNDVQQFTDGNVQNDDLTILELEYDNIRYESIKDHTIDVLDAIMSTRYMPKDEETLFKIRLSMEEVLVNIASYAYENGQDWVEVQYMLRQENDGDRVLVLRIKDGGKPFNPLGNDDPDTELSAEERNIGGLGIFLCKQMMDKLDYKYDNGCNILTMEKILNRDTSEDLGEPSEENLA